MRLLKLFSFLDKNSYADCIICKSHKRKSNFRFCESGAGICRECEECLPFAPVGQMFDGRGNVSYYFYLFHYTGILRKSIIDFKFNNCPVYGRIYAHYMSELIKGVYSEEYDFDMIVSVPLSTERFDERGFNQSHILAQIISENTGVVYVPDALMKVRNTRRQSELDAVGKMTNLKNAFRGDEKTVTGRHILLIDDIYTSGNTVRECASELKRCGAESVAVYTLAGKPVSQKSKEYMELLGNAQKT